MLKANLLKPTHLIKHSALKHLFANIIEKDFTYCVYFDIKNLLPIHKPHQQIKLLKVAKRDPYLIAKTLVYLASYWAKFFDEMGVDFVFVFFDDNQNYTYHFDLYPHYKIKRIERKKRQAKSMGKKYEMFQKLYKKNIRIATKAFLPFKSVFCISLTDIESDFIPYFCMKEFFTSTDYKHLILSNDKDFSQLLGTPHTYQVIQKDTKLLIRGRDDAFTPLLKNNSKELHHLKNPAFFPLALSLGGDIADSIKSIGRISGDEACLYLDMLLGEGIITDEDHTPQKLFAKVKNNYPISERILTHQDRIQTNYNLISFKEIKSHLSSEQIEYIKNLFLISPLEQRVLQTLCPSHYLYDCLK